MDLGPLPETFTICSSLYVEYLTTFLNFFSIKDVSIYAFLYTVAPVEAKNMLTAVLFLMYIDMKHTVYYVYETETQSSLPAAFPFPFPLFDTVYRSVT